MIGTLFGDFRHFINSIGIKLIKVKVNYNKQIENVYILRYKIFKYSLLNFSQNRLYTVVVYKQITNFKILKEIIKLN